MNTLRELFPDQDYGFRMTMRKGPANDFFGQRDDSGEIRAARRYWLEQDRAAYAMLLPEGMPLLSEANEMGASWALPNVTDITELAGSWEPDILFLSLDGAGRFRLRGGALCFPTGWALAEKLGQSLELIHGIVPGLNPAIGLAINKFLSGLKPGAAFHRYNWGISATNELNLHPSRRIPPPGLPLRLDRLWLRVENQALVALPKSRGILFGIRVVLHRLDEACNDNTVAHGISRALRTMPPPVVAYKGLSRVYTELISLLAING
jgi:dimethylamine monooxygenase subunit A